MSQLSPQGKPGKPVFCRTCRHEFPQDPCFSVSCPRCGASEGVFCKRPSGHQGPFVDFHTERDLKALAAGFYDHPNGKGEPCGKQSADIPTEEREALMRGDGKVVKAYVGRH